MGHILRAFALLPFLLAQGKACSDIFITKGGYHIEGRTLDFFQDLDTHEAKGLVGERHITNIVLDAELIPVTQWVRWENKYGYIGRSALAGHYLIDGLNTRGLSGAALYLPGSKFPKYNPKDKRAVVGVYDILSFILSQAATVSEALNLLHSHQLVQAAAHYKGNVFVKNIPIHYVFRDQKGKSAVVEFLEGKVKIYEAPGDVLTNAPSLDWQLKNLQNYVPPHAFLGLPGDYTPPSRFVRSSVLLKNLPLPSSHNEALYQAVSLTHSVTAPPGKGAPPTLWISIKDLDNLIYYTKDLIALEGTKMKYCFDINKGYVATELQALNFNLPHGYIHHPLKLTNPSKVKIVEASQTKAFAS